MTFKMRCHTIGAHLKLSNHPKVMVEAQGETYTPWLSLVSGGWRGGVVMDTPYIYVIVTIPKIYITKKFLFIFTVFLR